MGQRTVKELILQTQAVHCSVPPTCFPAYLAGTEVSLKEPSCVGRNDHCRKVWWNQQKETGPTKQ